MIMQKFINTGKKLTIADIKEIERSINITFPDDLINLYLQYNGGEIEGKKYFYIDEKNDIDVSVKTFMPIKYKRTENDVLLEDDLGCLLSKKS